MSVRPSVQARYELGATNNIEFESKAIFNSFPLDGTPECSCPPPPPLPDHTALLAQTERSGRWHRHASIDDRSQCRCCRCSSEDQRPAPGKRNNETSGVRPSKMASLPVVPLVGATRRTRVLAHHTRRAAASAVAWGVPGMQSSRQSRQHGSLPGPVGCAPEHRGRQGHEAPCPGERPGWGAAQSLQREQYFHRGCDGWQHLPRRGH